MPGEISKMVRLKNAEKDIDQIYNILKEQRITIGALMIRVMNLEKSLESKKRRSRWNLRFW